MKTRLNKFVNQEGEECYLASVLLLLEKLNMKLRGQSIDPAVLSPLLEPIFMTYSSFCTDKTSMDNGDAITVIQCMICNGFLKASSSVYPTILPPPLELGTSSPRSGWDDLYDAGDHFRYYPCSSFTEFKCSGERLDEEFCAFLNHNQFKSRGVLKGGIVGLNPGLASDCSAEEKEDADAWAHFVVFVVLQWTPEKKIEQVAWYDSNQQKNSVESLAYISTVRNQKERDGNRKVQINSEEKPCRIDEMVLVYDLEPCE